MRIGIDLDNTIVNYDPVFCRLAAPYLSLAAKADKSAVRDALRALPEGERLWQTLQGQAYGARMAEAEPFPGVTDFFRQALDRGVELHIVSHKTRTGHFDPERIDLRQASLAWLEAQGLVNGEGGRGLIRERIFFADDPAAKIARIAAIAPDWFIDDLPAIFQHPAFPGKVGRILFSPRVDASLSGVIALADWRLIAHRLLA
ncbi:MAG: haloacid dehalogenase-like hydrolase [Rhodospirillales bacterium]|nr:haloacid dehalogenase-like hydrolase [Rhodospirillales bacterium]